VQSIYDALYNYGTETWDIDPFNDLVTGSSGVLLGGDCAIWVYPDAYTKNAAINSGTFDSMGGNYFWDDADPDWYGVVLVADESSTCAADAETALGWNLADFSPTN
jgi:hypothetical protein